MAWLVCLNPSKSYTQIDLCDDPGTFSLDILGIRKVQFKNMRLSKCSPFISLPGNYLGKSFGNRLILPPPNTNRVKITKLLFDCTLIQVVPAYEEHHPLDERDENIRFNHMAPHVDSRRLHECVVRVCQQGGQTNHPETEQTCFLPKQPVQSTCAGFGSQRAPRRQFVRFVAVFLRGGLLTHSVHQFL